MGMFFLGLFIILLLSTFGMAVMLSLAWVAHVRYPLNRIGGAVQKPGNTRLLLYLLNFYPVLSFLFYFIPFPGQGYFILTIVQILLCIPAIVSSYQFYKLNKWNIVWLALNTLAGAAYITLFLVKGID